MLYPIDTICRKQSFIYLFVIIVCKHFLQGQSYFVNGDDVLVQVHENNDAETDLWVIEAKCDVHTDRGGSSLEDCDTCNVTSDPCNCLQINGMTIQKKACSNPLCGPTCLSEGCLNGGNFFKADIMCSKSGATLVDAELFMNFFLNVTASADPVMSYSEGNTIMVNRNQMESEGTVVNSILGTFIDIPDENDFITYSEVYTEGDISEIVNGPEFEVNTTNGAVYVGDVSGINLDDPASFRVSACIYDRRQNEDCMELRIAYTAEYVTTTSSTTTMQPTTTTATELTTTTTTTEPTTTTTTELTTTTTTTEPTTTTTTEPTTTTTTTEPTKTTTTELTTTTTTAEQTTTTTTEPTTTTTTTEPTTTTTMEPTTTAEPTTTTMKSTTTTEPTTTTTTIEPTTTTTEQTTTTTTTEPTTTASTLEPSTTPTPTELSTTTEQTTQPDTTSDIMTVTTTIQTDKCPSSSKGIGIIIGSIVAGLGALSDVGIIVIILTLRQNKIAPDTNVVQPVRHKKTANE